MPSGERPLALSIGQVGVELICRVPRNAPEIQIEMDEISIQVGGSAAIAAATAAALGCRARLSCKLAGDFLGEHIQKALGAHGIDTWCVEVESCQLSPLSFSVLGAHSGRATYFTRGDVEPMSAGELDPESLLAGVGAVLVDGTCPSAQVALAEVASKRDIPVVFDGDQIREGVGTLVGLADVLICSERLAADLAPRDDLETTLTEIQRLGPRAVIITLGQAGSIGVHGDQLVRQPSFPVNAADPGSAGAVYHGAFAAALLAQLPFATCMTFASAAAALSCQHVGGFAGIPRREDVVALVKSDGGPEPDGVVRA